MRILDSEDYLEYVKNLKVTLLNVSIALVVISLILPTCSFAAVKWTIVSVKLNIATRNEKKADCVSWRGRNAFIVKLLEVDFHVDQVVLVWLAFPDIEPDFRLEVLENRVLQHGRTLC